MKPNSEINETARKDRFRKKLPLVTGGAISEDHRGFLRPESRAREFMCVA